MSEAPTRHLGDVASFVRGITFKPGDVVPVGSPGSVACMRTKNVQSELDLSDVWGIPESFVKRADRYLLTGDLLVSSANSWNLVGKCCRVPQLQWPATFGGFISVLRGDPSQIEARYLYHWFSSPRIQATVRSLGQQTTNISNLNIDRCLRLWLPLPPLAEQKRIAGTLDAADALRAKRREALGQLDTLLQSTFLDMFGDPVTNPMGWEMRSLGGLSVEKPNNGVFRRNHEYSESLVSGLPVVWVVELFRGNRIDVSESRRLEATPAEIHKYGLLPGDLLFCRSSLKLDGIAYNNVFLGEREEALFECHLIRISPRTDVVNPMFLNLQLRSVPMRALLKSKSKTATMTTIDQRALSSIEVVVPPLNLQHRFAAIVESVERQKASQRAHRAELDTLFASLQSRAFRGDH